MVTDLNKVAGGVGAGWLPFFITFMSFFILTPIGGACVMFCWYLPKITEALLNFLIKWCNKFYPDMPETTTIQEIIEYDNWTLEKIPGTSGTTHANYHWAYVIMKVIAEDSNQDQVKTGAPAQIAMAGD